MAEQNEYEDYISMNDITRKPYIYLAKSATDEIFPQPSLGIIGLAPDVPHFPLLFQIALSFQNGLSMFDWCDCMPSDTAIITRAEHVETVTLVRDQIISGLQKKNNDKIVCPIILCRKYCNLESSFHMSDPLRHVITDQAAKGVKVFILDRFLSAGEAGRKIAELLYNLTVELNITIIATYTTHILVSGPEQNAVRQPLSFATFGDDLATAEVADWLLLGVQVSKGHVLAISSAKDVKNVMQTNRYFAFKFISSTVPVPYDLHFLRQTIMYPEMIPVELKK